MTGRNYSIGRTEAAYDRIWALGVAIRDVGKRFGLSGPIEPILTYLAPRLMPPPAAEVELSLPTGESLWIPANFPSYRNYLLGLYERDLRKLLPSIVDEGFNVVDLGANIGLYTIAMSRLVGSSGRVFAFEPDELPFSYLQRNISANRCDNVTAVRAAVTNQPGLASFIRNSVERGFVVSGKQQTNAITVPAVSLDSYFRARDWPNVDFVKLDIEGAEGDALSGMTELSQRNLSLKLVIEFNYQAIHRSGSTEDKLLDLLKNLGFKNGWVIERNMAKVALDAPLRLGGTMCNLLVAKD